MSNPHRPSRVFLSAASAEFQPLREQLAALLLRAGINVEYQEIFPQTAADVVRKLSGLISEAPLVVHLVGHQPGSVANASAVADLLDGIPPAQFLERAPGLRGALGDYSGLTYTQWEAMLALHYGVPLLVYAPADALNATTQKVCESFVQQTHLARLRLARKYPTYCNDNTEFVGTILADVYRHFGVMSPSLTPQNLPYASLGSLFKGRQSFLERLRTQLTTGKTTVIRGRQAIHGMGGVGKTRAAVEYAWAHSADYSALLFVTADSAEALERNLAALCAPRLLNLPEQEATETAVQSAAVRRWLVQHPGWLLLLDNVDTLDAERAVAALLPAIPDGHVVITSRLADWPAGVTGLDLDVLDASDSIAFLLERTEDRRVRRDTDRQVAADIAVRLDGLALALEQCAAYIRHRRCALADYVTDWDRKRIDVLDWHDGDKSHYPRSLVKTCAISVAQLSAHARQLFQVLSWVAPDPIPLWAIEKIPSLPDPRAQLVEVTDLHLAALSPDGATCTVHRLVQDVTRQRQIEAQPEALVTALAWVSSECPVDADDVRSWSVAIPLAPHAIAVATFAADHEVSTPTARVLNRAALLRFAQARHREAEPLMRRALAIDEASYGATHPTVASSLNNLAQLLKTTNRLTEAEPLMRRVLAIDEATYGSTHPAVATDLNNLAHLLRDTNRLAEAEPLMRRALAIDEGSYGVTHPTVAIRLNNLAQLLQDTNRRAEAEPLMRRALAIDEATYGATHPKVATDLNNLAQLLQDTNRLAEAEPLMRRVLAIDETSYGPTHPAVGRDLNNLATLLHATNRLAEAAPLMRRALAIDEASYEPTHPEVATDLNNLAQLLQATNRRAEAEPLMRRALAIDEASYGPNHPAVARDLSNLAQLLKATNRWAEAAPLMRRALAIDEASYGATHPTVATRLSNLAQLLQATNRLDEAEHLMRRALAIDEASYGATHPAVARDLNNLAQLLKATNRLAEAEPLLRRGVNTLIMFTRDTGHSHPHLSTAVNNYGELLLAMGATQEEAVVRLRGMLAEWGLST